MDAAIPGMEGCTSTSSPPKPDRYRHPGVWRIVASRSPLSSAYRCPKHNKAVGGVPTSAHTRGYAVDIRCVDSHSRFAILQALLEAGFRRIELAPTWIHVDNDPDKPRDVALYQQGGKY